MTTLLRYYSSNFPIFLIYFYTLSFIIGKNRSSNIRSNNLNNSEKEFVNPKKFYVLENFNAFSSFSNFLSMFTYNSFKNFIENYFDSFNTYRKLYYAKTIKKFYLSKSTNLEDKSNIDSIKDIDK